MNLNLPFRERAGDWLSEHWISLAQWLVALLALTVSAASVHIQLTAERHYQDNARQVLLNSNKLAIYDVDLLIYKMEMGDSAPISKDQLAYQVSSLKQNLSEIKDVKITDLPKRQSLNYQVYRENFSNIIYKLNDDVNGINKLSKVDADGNLQISQYNRNTFIKSAKICKQILTVEDKTLKKDGSLYNATYDKGQKLLDKLVE